MNIRIYDRYDKDIPFTSDMYILDTHYNFIVVTNIYNVTFHKEFETKEQAIQYYMEKL
ncbi:hypothetical protein PQE68_gp005 [Bacillus phage vB_BanS_Sophrita]|uniref:Uncharacterized protein n=1 Tax=Bacillus phage vB_BanS_Sophrita TaxID=2894790 RepID=A0AAE9CDZ2_9CAUD|nr:hypothetical protein PQE68_gp005 [Bacillus phage vB_BanS_Sophrita]UGO50596.1 hypothetical protein SOPHRITA_5 [Bacillus phage vB_BanS_Sophrita]